MPLRREQQGSDVLVAQSRSLGAGEHRNHLPGCFIPLHEYGESLDCLNRLLIAVGDEPFKERYVDINATQVSHLIAPI
jgi:hypothetical protein